jgi:predicted peptidase
MFTPNDTIIRLIRLALISMMMTSISWAENPNVERKVYEMGDSKLPYGLLIPDNLDSKKAYPLVIALHGAWGRGVDNKSRAIDAFEFLKAESVRKEFPAYLLTPQCPPKKQWANTPWGKGSYDLDKVSESLPVKMVFKLIDQLLTEHSIDPKRIFITGQSMGGFGTWDIIMRQPERFAAAVTVCGAGDPKQAHRLINLPIWNFHGDKDTVVPFKASREMDVAMRAAKHPSWTYTELPGVAHGSSKPAWKTKELIPWLFSQRQQ